MCYDKLSLAFPVFFFLVDNTYWIDVLHQASSNSDDKQCSNFTDQSFTFSGSPVVVGTAVLIRRKI